MLVLIDESGDPGFAVAKGATAFFVICLVVFHDLKQAEQCSRAIAQARTRLGWKGEFKFSKTKDSGKDAFFAAVSPFDFDVHALVVDKSKIHSTRLRSDDDTFYNYFLRQLLTHCDVLQNARIKIDGSGNREFRRHLNAYLRRMLAPGKIESVEFVDSARNNLIQLADMTAGAVARSFKHDTTGLHATRWRKALGRKLKDCWEFE